MSAQIPEYVANAHKLVESVTAFHALPDEAMASELLRLCRRATSEVVRAGVSLDSVSRGVIGPEDHLIRLTVHLGPEIARRLSPATMTPVLHEIETTGHSLRTLTLAELRALLASLLREAGMRATSQRMPALEALTNPPANGNPLLIGLDAIAWPDVLGNDPDDHFGRVIRKACVARGHEEMSSWSPSMMTRGAPRNAAEP